MSLKGELKRGDSWVNGFFKQRFPGVVDFVKREGAMVRSLATRVPSQSSGSARLVGTAFDYRLRMHFEPDFENSDELRTGIQVLLRTGSGLGEQADRKWADAMVALLREVPTGDPDVQARVSVVLAWLDSGYRVTIWDDGLRAIATAMGKGEAADWKGCTAGVDGAIAAEVADIMRLVEPPEADSVVCGPSFEGSAFVGGADADLIVDGCLFDVKTKMKPREDLPLHLRQVLGYALLDWNDVLALESVGFYFSRQGTWLSWALDDVVAQTAAAGATLRRLREEFRSLAHEHNPRLAERRRTPGRPRDQERATAT